jgi:hypothetical protein
MKHSQRCIQSQSHHLQTTAKLQHYLSARNSLILAWRTEISSMEHMPYPGLVVSLRDMVFTAELTFERLEYKLVKEFFG